MFLDEKLTFAHHLNEKISKANRGIGLIKRLYSYLPRKSLLNIYKSFIRPHLDYGDVIYNQPHNDTFCKMIESVQYNAALAITGAIKGFSRERLYQELGLESLSDFTRNLALKALAIDDGTEDLFIFFKLFPAIRLTTCVPCCLLNSDLMILQEVIYSEILPHTKHFFPNLRYSTSISIFKKNLLAFIRPKQCSIYNINNPPGLKLLTRLRVNLSV